MTKEDDKLIYEENGSQYATIKAVTLPDGYQFKDENGNVINAQKIVLEKKEKEYPKSLDECLEVLEYTKDALLSNQKNLYIYEVNLLADFQKLLICRDAYWKIAGEKMGLGEPWSPDWTDINTNKYCIYYVGYKIKKYLKLEISHLLAFPTEEMRDAFYENFKELIESVKELL